jgi:glycerol-3-phosphate dehydrogenase
VKRDAMIARLEDADRVWDIVIIGGGATGLGCAVDAAARGYDALLLERSDFAKGTSSRSTKLVHGGVRYLQQGNFSLVLEALRERGLLQQNAPHLVSNLPFVVPNYEWWEAPFYGVGLKLYDMMAGKLGFGASRILSEEETRERLPNIETEGLRGGVIYHDGQFDDARLAVALAQTAADQGATLVNYAQVSGLVKDADLVVGVEVEDVESGAIHRPKARVVINATGAFSDGVRRMDAADAQSIIQPSQGIHIVLDREFLPGNDAIMVPHTDDGRVVFVIPWNDRVVIGTTDTPVDATAMEPVPRDDEIDWLLETSGRYLVRDPDRGDVRATFAGIRPLVKSGGEDNTAALSRDHTVNVSKSGLVTIAGGKWTTYRKMAEDTIDCAVAIALLPERPCPTQELRLHGYEPGGDSGTGGAFAIYGSDGPELARLAGERPEFAERLHTEFDYIGAQVVWAVRHEMARTVEDVLARRLRALFLDTRASIAMAPVVAALMAAELGRDSAWEREQVEALNAVAEPLLVA